MTDNRTAAELLAEAERLADLAAERSRQVTRAELEHMSPEAIVAARRQGRLADLLNPDTHTEGA